MIDIFHQSIKEEQVFQKLDVDFAQKLAEVCKDVRPVKKFVRKNFLRFGKFDEDYKNVFALGQSKMPQLEVML